MPSWTYDQLEVGSKAKVVKTVTDDVIRDFARLSTDDNPVHLDQAYAEKTQFGKRIAHGMFSASLISAVLRRQREGKANRHAFGNVVQRYRKEQQCGTLCGAR